jgi:trigger factor
MALREPSLLPGVNAAMVGLEAGAEKDVTVTFPDEFVDEALAGKSIPYHFKVHEVHEAQVPELTDDLAKQVGAESADDVRERIRQNLAAEKAHSQESAVRDQLVQALLDGLDFPVPPHVLSRSTYEALSRIYEQEIRQGVPEDDLRSRQKELMERAGEVARQQLRRYYVLRKIADAEKIEVEPDELYSAVDSLSRSQRIAPKAMARRLRDSGRLGDVIVAVREAKTIDRLVSLAEISEPAGSDKE